MVSSKPSSSKKAKVSDTASKKVKGENFYHNAKTAGRLKMMKGGKPVYDRKGKMVQAAAFQKGEDETTPGRVQPDRRWFGRSWNLELGSIPLVTRLIYCQETLGLFLNPLWITSERTFRRNKMTRTPSSFDVTNFRWLYSTMLQTLTCGKCVWSMSLYLWL